ncbi:hypothetical protein LOK49_Contig329G00004 [Camellia lanceoleosa]|nr:hypothetical protein LOK49_Contig329G00004 [Camellia lanceoleosa]
MAGRSSHIASRIMGGNGVASRSIASSLRLCSGMGLPVGKHIIPDKPLPVNDELVWDNGTAFPEPCIDRIADMVGKNKGSSSEGSTASIVPATKIHLRYYLLSHFISVIDNGRAHYNVILKSIEVGDALLLLPSDGFDTDFGKPMIMDSGTTLAYLGDELFNPLMKKPAQPAPVPSTGPNANPLDLFPQGLPNMGSNAAGAGTLDFLRNSQQALLLLSLNLLFFTLVSSNYVPCPPPPPKTPKHHHKPPSLPTKATCPTDTLKLGVCADLLNDLVHLVIGTPPTTPSLHPHSGLLDDEVIVCLCTAIKANVLGINLNVPISLSKLLNCCGKNVPSGFQCA